MDCTKRDNDGGYATVAAVCFSLALGLMATALVQQAAAEYNFARSDLVRSQSEYALAAAQQSAALTVLTSAGAGPFHWRLQDGFRGSDVIAEPERLKLALASAATVDEGQFERLGVKDARALKVRLVQLATFRKVSGDQIEALDSAQVWRSCARSLISSDGASDRLPLRQAVEPEPGAQTFHVGELWRMVVRLPNGWSDERLVRFTGNPSRPMATVERRLGRRRAQSTRCDLLLEQAGGA